MPRPMIPKMQQSEIITTIAGKWASQWAATLSEVTCSEIGILCLRNVHQDIDGPWCYTTDPNQEWEVCFTSISSDSKSYEKISPYLFY